MQEENNSQDADRSRILINMGICKIMQPLIMDDRFVDCLFLQNNVYNLYGTLFFVDSKEYESYLDESLIAAFMNSIVSKEILILE